MFPNIRHGKYVDTFFPEERQKNKMKTKTKNSRKTTTKIDDANCKRAAQQRLNYAAVVVVVGVDLLTWLVSISFA